MGSFCFMLGKKQFQNRKPREVIDIWHYENPDYSPLCFYPDPSKRHWDGGIAPNPRGLLTTDNIKYVTCKRCIKILEDRGEQK